jgi:hypothetical protein
MLEEEDCAGGLAGQDIFMDFALDVPGVAVIDEIRGKTERDSPA